VRDKTGKKKTGKKKKKTSTAKIAKIAKTGKKKTGKKKTGKGKTGKKKTGKKKTGKKKTGKKKTARKKEPLAPGQLRVERLTPKRMDDLRRVQSGGWGSGCWCIYPRCTPAQEKDLPGPGGAGERRRLAMAKLARRKRAPGLLAYLDGEAVGWVAVAPRAELGRVDASRATPPVDDAPVWVIPCITVLKAARGRGVALALIQAAIDYAGSQGAPAVEAYARAGTERVHDDFAYYGTERLFRRAGFRVVRKPLPGLPRNWTPRVTMRHPC
jgi:GNAT superfamily N-acetyltransferase